MTTSRLEIYAMQSSGKISIEEAATAFGLTTSGLRQVMSKAGDNFAHRLEVLDKIERGELTRNEAAALLNCNTRQVNALMKNWSVHRTVSLRRVNEVMVQIKEDLQKKYAIQFIATKPARGELLERLDDLATKAAISSRQLRREIQYLLDTYTSVNYKELSEMAEEERQSLALQIEEKVYTEAASRQIMATVEAGTKRREQIAVEVAMSRRKYGKPKCPSTTSLAVASVPGRKPKKIG